MVRISLFSAGKSHTVLGRSPGLEGSTAVSSFPGKSTEWPIETVFLTNSGGTVPALHRTSLLSPHGRLRTSRKLIQSSGVRQITYDVDPISFVESWTREQARLRKQNRCRSKCAL